MSGKRKRNENYFPVKVRNLSIHSSSIHSINNSNYGIENDVENEMKKSGMYDY